MKKTLLTFFAALLCLFATAQFTVQPGVDKDIVINGINYRIFVPSDYATGSDYYLHIAFYGDGNHVDTNFVKHVPANRFLSPHNWDGAVHLNNGTVAKFIVFGIPSEGIQPNMYAAAIDSLFKVIGNKVNINDTSRFSASGFSGGPGRMWSYLAESSSPKRLLFQTTISMSPTDLALDITARSSTGRHWVWYSEDDPNGLTGPEDAQALYDDIGSSNKRITGVEIACHCDAIWDSCMTVTGLGSQNGGTANTNRWRWLVNENDGVSSPPPASFPFVVGQLRKKTYATKTFLYYLPDTAQRPTLKHYFIYNVLDASGQDSAYAVGRGLAKKYLNGWNGKVPLCNGDTAVFSMFTQVDNPHLKSAMELGIQLALDSLPHHIFDTAYSRRMKNIFTGIGRGPNTQLTYLMNKFVNGEGTSFFRDNFGVLVSLDHHDNGHIASNGWAEIDTPLKSWWWTSNLSGYPYLPVYTRNCKDSADNRNPGALTKITELAQNYSSVTWDSAYSTSGTTPANNVFLWIVDTSQCASGPPPGPEGPFVVGQLRKKTYNSRELLYYVPDTAQRPTLKYYFIYNMLDASGQDSAYAVGRGLAKKYKNGWNGKLPLCNGDTAIFTMVTQVQNPDLKADMETGIQWALDSLPNHVFDTAYARRMQNVFTGIGRGPTSELTYLMNKFTQQGQGNATFRKSFGVLVSLDHHDNGHIATNGWAEINSPFKSWWWTSNQSGYPYLPVYTRNCKDSADNRNPAALTKITELAQSYSSITWDSAYSTAGSSALNNVFRWIVDTAECVGMGGRRFPDTSPVLTETNGGEQLLVTPNPATHVLNIAWTSEGQKSDLQLLDMQGKVVYSQMLYPIKGANTLQVNIGKLTPGQYLLRLTTGNNAITRMFLKK